MAGMGMAVLASAAALPVGTSKSAATTPAQPPPSAYAGDAACAQCHEKQAQSYADTPHARDSAPASAETIDGSFSPQHNVLRTANPNLIVAMTSDENGFYQSAINISNPNHPTGEVERFDIVVGSGRHAQTYLYWSDDELYELPVSYWRWKDEWVLSPGYPPNEVHFERAVVPRCLECHGSYFIQNSPPINRFVKSSIVLGINCERCHGPGAEHVRRERSPKPPRAGSPDEAIVNPARLVRDRQISLCYLCHAGAAEPIRPSMTFLPGDRIEDFLKIQPVAADAPVDVHGNQVGKLEESRCFRSSAMTCSTCHDVHETQEDADSYSAHCLTCHKARACGRFKALGAAIESKCVDCHMPLQPSGKIVSDVGDRTLHAMLRSHKIAIYPDEAAKVEQTLGGTARP